MSRNQVGDDARRLHRRDVVYVYDIVGCGGVGRRPLGQHGLESAVLQQRPVALVTAEVQPQRINARPEEEALAVLLDQRRILRPQYRPAPQ